ncbi:HlyD family secretion protein [Luteolibacter luteus]|uniref:HlyD family secretion protein n=1 Tax=Luteolibacter luteus TaxID=2728835 RepID=A0A858RQJ0_9BACT|nr:HlyD family secretion protein [Luteolibacter luteus]QJE98390.1 HlyD family secretion protein [Luteolibacter luteus]
MSNPSIKPSEENSGETGILPDESTPDAGSGKAPKKRGIASRLLTLGFLAGGVAWGVHFVHESMTYEKTDDAYITGHIHRISPGVAGPVLKVLVEENQHVKAGQELAEIDPLEFAIARQKLQAAKAQADASLVQALAALDRSKAEEQQAEAQVGSASAMVKQTEAQLDLANVNYHRNSSLFNGGTRAVSEAEVDTTRSVVATTTASLEAAKAAHAAAEAKKKTSAAAVEVAEAEVQAAKATIEAQAAALREIERQFADTKLVAPADGIVGNKNIETGNRVQAGQPVFALVENDYWVVANFKETQLGSMKTGQDVEIRVDALDGKAFHGKIESIAPSTGAQFALLPPDNATGNFTKVVQRVPVKIVFDADSIHGFEDSLRPGLSTMIRVKVKG